MSVLHIVIYGVLEDIITIDRQDRIEDAETLQIHLRDRKPYGMPQKIHLQISGATYKLLASASTRGL
jgi:hypothetical protein